VRQQQQQRLGPLVVQLLLTRGWGRSSSSSSSMWLLLGSRDVTLNVHRAMLLLVQPQGRQQQNINIKP
jgi:hypothetical protein